MAKIYLSYGHPDAGTATGLSDELRQLEHEVIMSSHKLSPGLDWRDTLMQALKTADAMVVLLGEQSLQSRFVRSEIGAARGFTQESKRLLVIPVLLDQTPAPAELAELQCIRATDRDLARMALEIDGAITNFLGKKAAHEVIAGETKNRIETNAAVYVEEAITRLRSNERRDRRNGSIWATLGYATLILGVAFGGYGVVQVAATADVQWIRFAYFGLKSIIVIGLLLACSKYAFILGKTYMNESLKSADRIHAISFGKFYLQAYGETAQWADLKEVFQHWNVSNGSTFSAIEGSSFDPRFVEALVEVAKAVTSRSEKK